MLPLNSQLGPYEIQSELGIGGMGEVYRARDTRLDREVALKILRKESAEDPERRARFEREARAVAALNHPNIVAVYDFGIEDGQQYIVSELVEGDSLRSLLNGKPVAVRKLVDIATQIGDGLAAAHAAGIVHRDLKPENIMLTAEGRAKILDFGLARREADPVHESPAKASSDSTMSFVPPSGDHLTHAGAVLGTAAYMSPEQALGRDAGFQSDQFSLGLILYELASGHRPFARATAVETMAAIVRQDAPPLDEKLPTPLRWIIDRCLAKEPEQRYGSTRDLYQDLRNLRDHPTESYSRAIVAPPPRPRTHLQFLRLAVICAGCMAFAAFLAYVLKPTGQDIARYRYTPIANDAYGPVWSPDGKALAYAARVDGIWQVFIRYLNAPAPLQLTHENHSVGPMGWSKDKSHLILWETTGSEESRSYKFSSIATVGGDLNFIADADCEACDLSRDGKAMATFAEAKDGTYGVSVTDPFGSPLRPYTPAPFASKDLFHGPQLSFSPDGSQILLSRSGAGDKNQIWLLPYPPSGQPPRRVLQNLAPFESTPSFGWMPDGRHLVVSLAHDPHSPPHLWVADLDSSSLTPLTAGNADERFPVVSPDGKRLIYSQANANLDVVSLSVENGAAQTLISTGRQESMAAWSANQPKLAWVTNRNGPLSIWIQLPDGTEHPLVTAADFPTIHKSFMTPALSPDGQKIVYVRVSQTGVTRLWISSLAGGAPIRLTDAEPSAEYGGAWSPDGGRFAYLQVHDGKDSLMVARISGAATPVTLVSNVLEYLPDWSPDGRWITYRDDKGWSQISPDGKSTKFLGKIETPYLAYSKDGKLFYGIDTGQTEADRDRATLFSLDAATLQKKVIKELGKDLRPASNLEPGIRFSLAPDGKSLVYTTAQFGDDLWMLQGYRQPGLWNRIKDALPGH